MKGVIYLSPCGILVACKGQKMLHRALHTLHPHHAALTKKLQPHYVNIADIANTNTNALVPEVVRILNTLNEQPPVYFENTKRPDIDAQITTAYQDASPQQQIILMQFSDIMHQQPVDDAQLNALLSQYPWLEEAFPNGRDTLCVPQIYC